MGVESQGGLLKNERYKVLMRVISLGTFLMLLLQFSDAAGGHGFWSNWEIRSIQGRAFAPVEKSKIE